MQNIRINPWTIAGITDAEGNFNASIVRMQDNRSAKFSVTLSFEIGLNAVDKILLDNIKSTLNVGNISYNSKDNTYRYKVSNIEDLTNYIIPHFKKYPLITQKGSDFKYFNQIVQIVREKGHLTPKGLQQIVNIKATWNGRLSETLNKSFPETKIAPRAETIFSGIPDPYWLSGFTDGEACFYISIYKSEKSKLGYAIQLVFKVTQLSRDKNLLVGISEYLSCGRVEDRKTGACDFTVTSFKSHTDNIIPFFDKYPLQSSKHQNYLAFKKVIEIMKVKGHLSSEGLGG